ncbi:unnamed protein product [Diamesa tonsa]
MSPDNTKVLVRYDERHIFRHSTVSKFSIIFLSDLTAIYDVSSGAELQLCFFSPDGNSLGYVMDNNIFYVKFIGTAGLLPQMLTADGVPGVIYNGAPDWVYEEEVLSSDGAVWFSPDSTKLAFMKFDDTNVREFIYDLYGESEDVLDKNQYPEEVRLRYPKAGTNNPVIKLIVIDLITSGEKEMPIPIAKVSQDHILGAVNWIDDNHLGAIWMNRRQNYGTFLSYDVATMDYKELLEINEPNGWIDVNTPKCNKAGDCYFVNNFNGWPALTSISNKLTVNHHSEPGQSVMTFIGMTDDNYFYSATPKASEPAFKHTYSKSECLTCGVTSPEGHLCSYASTSFSKDFSYYALTCSGPDPSFTRLYKTESNTLIYSWQENTETRKTLADEYDLPTIKIFNVPIEGTKFEAAVKCQIPSEIDLDATKFTEKHALLIRVYGGPGSLRVMDSFSIGYQSYLITTKKVVHCEIDGRGTANKGIDLMFSVNNQLGTFEMDDQISITKYLVNKYKFIDPLRVAIWGWSYGGYATAMTLAKDTEKVFQCGISVAPVTNWWFYDSIYTERYMGLPNATFNELNYKAGDVANAEHIEQIGKHDFFLIHGNGDDNVHYQQSMVLARALEMADIMFEQLSYPDEAHGLSGVQKHLYHSMDKFWNKCLKLKK